MNGIGGGMPDRGMGGGGIDEGALAAVGGGAMECGASGIGLGKDGTTTDKSQDSCPVRNECKTPDKCSSNSCDNQICNATKCKHSAVKLVTNQ